MEVYNDRFNGGCCGGADLLTNQKIVTNGPKRVFGFVAARQLTRSVWFIVVINKWLFASQYTGTKKHFEKSALLPQSQTAYRAFLQFISFSRKQAFTICLAFRYLSTNK